MTTGVLYKAGVPVSMTTDHPVIPIQHFLTQVEVAVDHGLPLDGALEVVTTNAAKALGLEDKIGALKPGFDGDVVVLTAPPGAPGCRVMKTIIEGEVVFANLTADPATVTYRVDLLRPGGLVGPVIGS